MRHMLVGVPVFLPDHIRLQIPEYTPGKDYVQVEAECCGEIIWIGPKQAEAKLADPSIPLVCVMCVARAAKQQGFIPEVRTMENVRIVHGNDDN